MPVRVGLRYTFVTLAWQAMATLDTTQMILAVTTTEHASQSISSCTYSVNSLQHSVQGVSMANKVNNARLLAKLIGTMAFAGHLPLFNTEQSALPKNSTLV